MSIHVSSHERFETLQPAMTLQNLALMLAAVIAGALAAVFVLPLWLPSLTASIAGAAPKAFWYLSRSSAFVAYALLWLSMVFGLLMTNKLARVWPGGPTAFEVHQHFSLLGLAMGLFHALILMGDKYLNLSALQVLVPFAASPYRPLWVGLGQVGFYLMAVLGLSFYVRKPLGTKTWRLLHYLSFGTYLLALGHGLTSGTDTATLWASVFYWATGGVVLLLFIYRLLAKWVKPANSLANQHAR